MARLSLSGAAGGAISRGLVFGMPYQIARIASRTQASSAPPARSPSTVTMARTRKVPGCDENDSIQGVANAGSTDAATLTASDTKQSSGAQPASTSPGRVTGIASSASVANS